MQSEKLLLKHVANNALVLMHFIVSKTIMQEEDEMVDLSTNLFKIPRNELLRDTRRHLICCLGSVSMSVTLSVLIGLYREDTGEDLLATSKALCYPSIEAMLHSDEFSDIVAEEFTDKAIGIRTNTLNPEKVHCYSVKISKRIEHIVKQMVDSSSDREQKNAKLANPAYDSRVLEGKERLFRSLAALGGEDEAIALVELQKQYFRDNGILLDKAELRKYFSKSHIKQICDMYMYKEIEIKTDIQRTGSLYLKMKLSLNDFLEECNEIRAQRQGNSLISESLPVMEEQNKQKKDEYKPVLVSLNNRTDSIYTQDEELARRIYASMSLSGKGLSEAGEDEDELLAELIGKGQSKNININNDKEHKIVNDDESLNLLPTSKFDLNNKMVRQAYYANNDTLLLEFSDTEDSTKKESVTNSAIFSLKTLLEKEHLKAGTSVENGSNPTTEAAVNNHHACIINSYKFADDLMKLDDDGVLLGLCSTTSNSKNNLGRVESVENLTDISRENDPPLHYLRRNANDIDIVKHMTPIGNVKELQEIIANGVRNWNPEGNSSFPRSFNYSNGSNFISNGSASNGYQKSSSTWNGSSISKNFGTKNSASSKAFNNDDGTLSPSTILSLYNKANGVDDYEDDNILGKFEKTTSEKKTGDKIKYTTRGDGIFTDEESESSSSEDELEEGNRQVKIEQLRNEEREHSFSSSKPMNGHERYGDIDNEIFEVPFGNKRKEEHKEQKDKENSTLHKHDDKDIFALENLNKSHYIAPAEKYIRMAAQQREEVEARKMAFRIAQQQSRQTSSNGGNHLVPSSSKVADRYQVATQHAWRNASDSADEERHFVDNDFLELTVKKEVQLRQKVSSNHHANKPLNKYEGIDVYTLVANISSIVMIRQPFVAIKELQNLLELLYNNKFSPIDDEMELLQFIKKYCRFIGFISTSEILLIWMQQEGQPFQNALRNAGKLCLLY